MKLSIAITAALVGLSLGGCLTPLTANGAGETTREIRMWVEPIEWEIHPGVTTTVWAFCAEGDGVEPVNGERCGVPGPTLRVKKGDTVRVTFENTHSIPHTVHFHGWHDFPPDMNGNELIHHGQVVKPGETRVMEWRAEPSGTFIYHCHFETVTHMEMGMYGAFIVEDPAETNPPDKEFVAVLDEWAIGNDVEFHGNMPAYTFFTINGKSFPLTEPWIVEPGESVRVHMVNAGYEFHAMHLHGHTPLAYEGVAGPKWAIPTDVREIAPGQSVVLDFPAHREGVWLFHDHVVPRVTAAANGEGFGTYPRGMLTVLAVGDAYVERLGEIAPQLAGAAKKDVANSEAAHEGHDHGSAADGGDTVVVDMKNVAFSQGTITVPAGTTVKWTNSDPMVHTVTADDGSFDSGDVAAGAAWSRTFDEPGTFTYHCVPHAYKDKTTGDMKGMVGTVIVESAEEA